METILVIEPSQGLCDTINASVEASSFQIIWAFDEETAWDVLAKRGVSAIVVNVDAASMQKSKLIETVRRQRRHHQAHIIAVSERPGPHTLEQSMKSGADDFMSGIVQPQELRNRFAWAASGSQVLR